MHAPKVAKPSSTVFTPPIPKATKSETITYQGRLSPLAEQRFGLGNARVLQTMKAKQQAQQQGKGANNTQASSQPAEALKGSGQPLSPDLIAKYENLLGGVSLRGVRVHQGAKVDTTLESSGLQGLTDGKNVAISSKAERSTLEHELGHVAQQQKQGFNLTEGTRSGYEQDADRIAARLISGSRVEGFEEGSKFSSSPLQAKKSAEMQAKCACEKKKQMMGRGISQSEDSETKGVLSAEKGKKNLGFRLSRGATNALFMIFTALNQEFEKVSNCMSSKLASDGNYSYLLTVGAAACEWVMKKKKVKNPMVCIYAIVGFVGIKGLYAYGECIEEIYGVSIMEGITELIRYYLTGSFEDGESQENEVDLDMLLDCTYARIPIETCRNHFGAEYDNLRNFHYPNIPQYPLIYE